MLNNKTHQQWVVGSFGKPNDSSFTKMGSVQLSNVCVWIVACSKGQFDMVLVFRVRGDTLLQCRQCKERQAGLVTLRPCNKVKVSWPWPWPECVTSDPRDTTISMSWNENYKLHNKYLSWVEPISEVRNSMQASTTSFLSCELTLSQCLFFEQTIAH